MVRKPDDPAVALRRRLTEKSRTSRRPSRHGRSAGSTPTPDRRLDSSGFPSLLAETLRRAGEASTVAESLEVLLTLDGHVPGHVSRSAMNAEQRIALEVRFGDRRPDDREDRDELSAMLALTVTGRTVLIPPRTEGMTDEEIVGTMRLAWSRADTDEFERLRAEAVSRRASDIEACRAWLEGLGENDRGRGLRNLRDAAIRTAPFVLFSGRSRYTNFRESNNLPGKTLGVGDPTSVLTGLEHRLPSQWPDDEVVLVATLMIVVRSGGYARIEECNGTHLDLDRVAELLEARRALYASATAEVGPEALGIDDPALPGVGVASSGMARVEALVDLADRLAARRDVLRRHRRHYRVIFGPLLHKVEHIAGAVEDPRGRERELCALLSCGLPTAATSLAELADRSRSVPQWLVTPTDRYGTGLEELVHDVTAAACEVFEADFAMSRGMRSLSELVDALRREDWTRITAWDLPAFFCCVVPSLHALGMFESPENVADAAWAMSARMQYNSWHFLTGNLPESPERERRDYFVPPSIPDLSYYSDQHHRGHVAAGVRFSIRSPQPVTVLGRTLSGFVDLRLLRCSGEPFDEQDLLVADRVSRLIAAATTSAVEQAAWRAETDPPVVVRAFDPSWHRDTIIPRFERAVHPREEKPRVEAL